MTTSAHAGSPAALAGLCLALVVPSLLVALPQPGGIAPMGAVLINEAIVWSITLALLALVRFWERRPLRSIGLGQPTAGALGAGLLAALGLCILAGIAIALLSQGGLPLESKSDALVQNLPLWLQLLVALSAGFTEEVLFRGYPIERITELTRSRLVGAIVPVLVFGAVHAPFWGVGHAIVAGLSGLWLTLLYLWRRNLWTNIAAHAALDAAVFLAARASG